MSVREYCREKVESIVPTTTLREAAERIDRSGVGCLAILEDGRARGLVTDRDIALAVLDRGFDADRESVQSIRLSRPAISIEANRPLRAAAAEMRRHQVRRLLVVDDDERLVGIISRDDLLQLLGRELDAVGGVLHVQEPAGSALLVLEDVIAPA